MLTDRISKWRTNCAGALAAEDHHAGALAFVQVAYLHAIPGPARQLENVMAGDTD
jgi:hypothetical protein